MRKLNFPIYRKPQDPSQYLNRLIITACDNTQLLVGMSKRNVINTTSMCINLKDETTNYLLLAITKGEQKSRAESLPPNAVLVLHLDCMCIFEQYALRRQHLKDAEHLNLAQKKRIQQMRI